MSPQQGNSELILGPFQGPIACVHIAYGRGVCGTAWKERRTVVVPDVEEFPGHIACSSESRSEIVVPVFSDNEVVAVLDIDADNALVGGLVNARDSSASYVFAKQHAEIGSGHGGSLVLTGKIYQGEGCRS